MRYRRIWLAWLLAIPIGCTRYRDDLDYSFPVEYEWDEANRGGHFTLFQGVWWDRSIGPLIDPLVAGQAVATNRAVLDLFSGPGLIATLCGQENALRVLSIAESKAAAACARYNVAFHNQDSIVTVRDLDLTQSPTLPSTTKFDVIFAVLADTAPLNSDVSLPRKLEIFAECVNLNLKTGGRAFAVCENESVADQLNDLCQQQGLSATLQSGQTPRFTVWEIKVLAKNAFPSATP